MPVFCITMKVKSFFITSGPVWLCSRVQFVILESFKFIRCILQIKLRSLLQKTTFKFMLQDLYLQVHICYNICNSIIGYSFIATMDVKSVTSIISFLVCLIIPFQKRTKSNVVFILNEKIRLLSGKELQAKIKRSGNKFGLLIKKSYP